MLSPLMIGQRVAVVMETTREVERVVFGVLKMLVYVMTSIEEKVVEV